VRRIFTLYAAGASYKVIASTLNDEGIESPYGSTRWKEKRRGWSGGTIRAMLLNERYVGRFHWNKRKFIGIRGKTRKAVRRAPEELVTSEMPDLAVVSKELWTAVQARLARHGHNRHRPAGSGKTTYLLTGLLRCGKCGGSMSTVGSKKKAGVKYVHIGCSAHWGKGAAICATTGPSENERSQRRSSAISPASSRSRRCSAALWSRS
jgi:site-specific DNA recombinase